MSGRPDLAVRVENLERRFGDFVAVDRLSFEVPVGEIFGFLGPNGAGKSTAFETIVGFLRPTSGRVEMKRAGYTLTVVEQNAARGAGGGRPRLRAGARAQSLRGNGRRAARRPRGQTALPRRVNRV